MRGTRSIAILLFAVSASRARASDDDGPPRQPKVEQSAPESTRVEPVDEPAAAYTPGEAVPGNTPPRVPADIAPRPFPARARTRAAMASIGAADAALAAGDVPRARAQLGRARRTLEQVLSRAPGRADELMSSAIGDAYARVLAAELLLREGRVAEARRLLEAPHREEAPPQSAREAPS